MLGAEQWWLTPLITACRRQRQVDLCEFEASLVYRASFRTGKNDVDVSCLLLGHTEKTK